MTRFTNAKEAIQFIENIGYTKKGIDNFKQYLDSIGNPQNELQCIHVAGTNGKGSTTNYIRAILQGHGLHVATFTSPYLIIHNDRIRINDDYISDQDILVMINDHIDSWIAWELSMFEIDMCISLLYFIEKQVDVAIYEVGIGGRYDVTNLIHASVGVITNIGMDHKEMLGDSYKEIAYQKAGIIKDGMYVVTAETKEECLLEFEKEVVQNHSVLTNIQPVYVTQKKPNVIFDYAGYNDVELSTFAVYQANNAALAIEAACKYLELQGIKCDEHIVKQALKNTFWKGRMEIVHSDPTIVIDGAHNLEGIQALRQSFEESKKISILFGVLRQKDYLSMYDELMKISEDITICFFDNSRSIHLEDLPNSYRTKISYNFKEVVDQAIKDKSELLICGSLYFISEVREYLVKENE